MTTDGSALVAQRIIDEATTWCCRANGHNGGTGSLLFRMALAIKIQDALTADPDPTPTPSSEPV